jgi:hypothetical protein
MKTNTIPRSILFLALICTFFLTVHAMEDCQKIKSQNIISELKKTMIRGLKNIQHLLIQTFGDILRNMKQTIGAIINENDMMIISAVMSNLIAVILMISAIKNIVGYILHLLIQTFGDELMDQLLRHILNRRL